MSQLSFQLFGSPQIKIDNQRVDFGRHKAMALCAYLAATGQPHRRDGLATMLWPWQNQSNARASLRRVLHTATSAIGRERFALTRETIGLVEGSSLWVDVHQFKQTIKTPKRDPSGQPADTVWMGRLKTAADLYRGDFLAGFTLRDAPDFDTWQYMTAQDLRRSAVDMLRQLAESHMVRDEPEQAINFAQRWLSLDPLDERAHRTLIRLHADTGNRAQALHQYDQCCRLLEDELGVSPDPETVDLIDSVRANRFATRLTIETGPSARPVVRVDTTDTQAVPQEKSSPTSHGVGESVLSEIRTLTALSLAIEFGGEGFGQEEATAPSTQAETAALEEFKRTIHTLSESFDATIDHLGGDGGLLFFGLPRSHEDDAERALYVAFELLRLAATSRMRLAIGIRSGAAYVSGNGGSGTESPTVSGALAGQTAMLQRRASVGQVLVDRHTWRRTRNAYHMQSAPTPEGVQSSAGPVYIVTGSVARPLKSRGILGLKSELIGRDNELAELHADFRRVSEQSGKLVFVIGSAGVGKSRLITEVKARVKREKDVERAPVRLEGRCLEMSKSSVYWPFREMVRSYFSRGREADHVDLAARVESGLRQMVDRRSLTLDEAAGRCAELGAALGGLLDIRYGTNWDLRLSQVDAAQMRARTMAALVTFFRLLSMEHPLILEIEDVHWADDLSVDLIIELMAMGSTHPILLLCILRPDPADRLNQLTSAAAANCPGNYREIRLHELSPAQNRRMIASLLKTESLSPATRDWILARAQGNPFFTEEVVRALIDAGVIVHEISGDESSWQSRGPKNEDGGDFTAGDTGTIPHNIDSLIHSRVDRLQPAQRRQLQIAATLGRTFSLPLLKQLVDEPVLLADSLQLFQQRGFIYLERSSPEPEYSFQHVLTQEAVYRMLPQEDRVRIHGDVVKAIESTFADQLDAKIEILAHHAARTRDHAKASLYLAGAAEKARRSYLNQDAIRLFEQALDRLKLLDQEEPSSELGQRQAYICYQLGRAYFAEGQHDRAELALRDAIAIGQANGAAAHTVTRYYYWLGEALFWLGRRAELAEMAQIGLNTLDPSERSVESAMLIGHLAIASGLLFGPNRFCEIAEQLADFILDLPFSEELSPSFTHVIEVFCLTRQVGRAFDFIDALEERSRQNDDLNSLAKAIFMRGQVLALSGDYARSFGPTHESLTICRKTGEATILSYAREQLSRDCCFLGQTDEARHWAKQMLESSARWRAWAYRTLGISALCAGDSKTAAQEVSRSIVGGLEEGGMNSLNTHLMLARSLIALGQRAEACERLFAALEPGAVELRLEVNIPLQKPPLPGCISLLEKTIDDQDRFVQICDELSHRADIPSGLFTQWHLEATSPASAVTISAPVTFGCPLTEPWQWHDPFGDCSHRLDDGLVIQAADGRDLWYINSSAPRFLRVVEGELAAETICSPTDDGRPTMGGLLLWFNESNFIRLDRGSMGEDEITLIGCLDNEDAIFGRGRLPGQRITLRLERIGHRIRALCRIPDQEWYSVGSVEVPVDEPYEVGMFACGFVDRTLYPGMPAGGGSIRFESFCLEGHRGEQ